jgi:hypothetical protein
MSICLYGIYRLLGRLILPTLPIVLNQLSVSKVGTVIGNLILTGNKKGGETEEVKLKNYTEIPDATLHRMIDFCDPGLAKDVKVICRPSRKDARGVSYIKKKAVMIHILHLKYIHTEWNFVDINGLR